MIHIMLTFNKKMRLSIFFFFFIIILADQCFLISDRSVLPSKLTLPTDSTLSFSHFTKDIFRTINNLDPNKAHGHDKISICMLKICGDSICRHLTIIF